MASTTPNAASTIPTTSACRSPRIIGATSAPTTGGGPAPPVLVAHGITPGPNGYAVAELEAFATAHGWQCSVESIAGVLATQTAPTTRWPR